MPLLFAVAFYLAAFGMGWLVLINGWGLEPQSWGWIIGGTVASLILMALAQLAVAMSKD